MSTIRIRHLSPLQALRFRWSQRQRRRWLRERGLDEPATLTLYAPTGRTVATHRIIPDSWIIGSDACGEALAAHVPEFAPGATITTREPVARWAVHTADGRHLPDVRLIP